MVLGEVSKIVRANTGSDPSQPTEVTLRQYLSHIAGARVSGYQADPAVVVISDLGPPITWQHKETGVIEEGRGLLSTYDYYDSKGQYRRTETPQRRAATGSIKIFTGKQPVSTFHT